ncbi:alpha/beta hydrolase fold-1 protein [Seiridium cupressi]
MKGLNYQKAQRIHHVKRLVGAFVLLTCIFFSSNFIRTSILELISMPASDEVANAVGFVWESLTPSRELSYHPCYGKFQCARIELPMDWTADAARQWDHTVAIALIKLAANVSASDPSYGGEIYVNPGGPGASGVEFARAAGASLARFVSAGAGKTAKQFDIVGFDPRGVMHSTPRPTCFPDLKAPQLWYHMTEAYESPTDSNATFTRLLARTAAYRKMCDPGKKKSGSELLKRHLSSAYVARDLLAILDRSGEATFQLVRASQGQWSINSGEESPKAMLRYWGFSYGTVLGGYFASLFPDRHPAPILRSIEESLSACHAAGKEKCSLYEEDGPVEIERIVLSNLEKLRKSPMAIWKDGMLVPEVLTYEMVINTLFESLYSPYRAFPPLSERLAALGGARNITALEYFLPTRDFTCTDDICRSPGCVDKVELFLEPGLAFLNSDSLLCGSSGDFFEIAKMLKKQSPLFGEKFQVDVATGLNAWPVEPKWKFTGPMGGRTKHPILFIGNAGDPVGPVQNAMDNAKLFEGAVALTQDSIAHGSISAPSLCTARYVRDYFQDGTLPDEGTICKPDWLPFEEPRAVHDLMHGDIQLMNAILEMMNFEGYTKFDGSVRV